MKSWLSKLLLGGALMGSQSVYGMDVADFPDPAIDVKPAAGAKTQTAVLAGGCFWCTEAVFEQLGGVTEVKSGYSGGSAETAKYDTVSAGGTEHAEAIRIKFEPAKVSYGQLLKVFFSIAHDPTQLNRQGPDWGKQYRSAVFYVDDEQKKVAEAYIAQLNAAAAFDKKIVTQVVPLTKFYPAEDYHQDFVKRNPRQGYVVANAQPKVEKVRRYCVGMLKK
jgi:peptide-methionine (S)-S-oxide reductase